MKAKLGLTIVLFFSLFLNSCGSFRYGIAHISAGIKDIERRNSTHDMCLKLKAVYPRVSKVSEKYYYDRCEFQGPGETISYAYCPKNSIKSGKMEIGKCYMVHANFWGKYGETIDPNEGMFFNPDGNVIPCQE